MSSLNSTPGPDSKPAARSGQAPGMTRRQVLEALSGLLMGVFVAVLASTVVSTSLPRIIADLGGDQTAYTWVVTATLLATTVSTPLWGKLADLLNRKILLQLSLVLFALGSTLAGFCADTGTLIVFRVVQGLGAGGLMSLVQVVIADIISPRERGRYMGLVGAVMSVGTVGGPLLGGLITDTLGWRWNFFVAIPIAIVAIVLIQKTLHLPYRPGRVVIDYWGALLIASGVSLLLIWVSLAGHQFEWSSLTSYLMAGGALVLLVLAVVVELRAKEPMIPLSMFRNRTFALAVCASISVGVAMFGTSVFLAQYLQLARGATPTESGVLTLPMVSGTLVASIVAGALISKYGRWKPYMVAGSVLMTVGLGLMATIRYDTDFVFVALYMASLGLGVGMVMQNLVLVVQNSVSIRQIGAASANVAFFRSLGGAIGVAVMGSVLGSRVRELVAEGFERAGIQALGGGVDGGQIPDLAELPAPIRTIVESAYGEGVADIFLIAAPLAMVTIVTVALLPNVPLGTKSGIDQYREQTSEVVIDVNTAEAAVVPPEDVAAVGPDRSVLDARAARGAPGGDPV